MPAGRPIEYNQETLIKAEEYLSNCKDTLQKEKKRVNLPKLEGLALALDISRETVYDWKRKYPEFSDIVDKILAEQANRLVNHGLAGNYNSNIAKLLLHKHGYKEQLGLSGEGEGEPVNIDVGFQKAIERAYGDGEEAGDDS